MNKVKSFLGCGGFLVVMGGVGFWLYLLHWLLSVNDAPARIWTAYWIYFPITIAGSILMAVFNVLPDDD